jgi:hypothetical protein
VRSRGLHDSGRSSCVPSTRFAKYIISATTPFSPDDVQELRNRAPQVVRRYVPEYKREYARRGWTMMGDIDRVYANDKARAEFTWRPRNDFRTCSVTDECAWRCSPAREPLLRTIVPTVNHIRPY